MDENIKTNSAAPANVGDAYGKTDAAMGVVSPEDDIATLLSSMAGLQNFERPAAQPTPHSYYEPDNEPIIKGYAGGMPLVSAGIPMFSMSVLKQAEEELQAAKRAKYESDMKDVDSILADTVNLQIADNNKNLEWQNIQTATYEKLIKDNSHLPLKELKRVIQKEAARVKAVSLQLDDTFNQAKEIYAMSQAGTVSEKGKSRFYVSPTVATAAKEYIDYTMSDAFGKGSLEEIYKRTNEAKRKFVKATYLADAVEPYAKALNDSSIESFNEDYIKAFGKDRLYEINKVGGRKLFETDLKNLYQKEWESAYNSIYGSIADKDAKPSYQAFENEILAQSKSTIEKSFQKLSSHKPDKDDGGGKTNYTLINDSFATVGTVNVPVKDKATFNPVDVATQSQGRGVFYTKDGAKLEIVQEGKKYNSENYLPKVASVVNVGGYSWAIGNAERWQVFAPLTDQIAGAIIAKNGQLPANYRVVNDSKTLDEQMQYFENNKDILNAMFIESKPSLSPKDDKQKYEIKGKTYTLKELQDMGYTEEQVREYAL
jgi:hypothetical protein